MNAFLDMASRFVARTVLYSGMADRMLQKIFCAATDPNNKKEDRTSKAIFYE